MNDTTTCWADPLSREERRTLAGKLARACGATWRQKDVHGVGEPDRYRAISTSVEMSTLHMDVTERAQVPTS